MVADIGFGRGEAAEIILSNIYYIILYFVTSCLF